MGGPEKMKPLPLAFVSLAVGVALGALASSWIRVPAGGRATNRERPSLAEGGAAVGEASAKSGVSRAAPGTARSRGPMMAGGFEVRGYEAAAKSPDQAIAEAKGIENQRQRAEFLRGVFLKVAEAGPAKALELLGQLDDGDRPQALLTLAYAWMPEGKTVPFGSLIQTYGLEAGLGYQFLKTEPPDVEMAVQWARALMSGQRVRGAVTLLGAAAREIAKTDPTRAFELGKDLKGGDRDRFVADVAEGWASADPAAAAEWVRQFPPGPGRDRAYLAVVKPWADKDPASAAAAAEGAADTGVRGEAIQAVAQQWTDKDEAAARAWAASLADPAARAAAESGIWNARPVGVGLVLRSDNSGAVLIGGLMDGGPAARTGQLRENDRIVAVGQPGGGMVDVRGMTMQQLVGMLRGSRGTAVTLQVAGEDGAPRTVSVVRDDLKLQ